MDLELNKAIHPEPIDTPIELLTHLFTIGFPGHPFERTENTFITPAIEPKYYIEYVFEEYQVIKYNVLDGVRRDQRVYQLSYFVCEVYTAILIEIYGSGT